MESIVKHRVLLIPHGSYVSTELINCYKDKEDDPERLPGLIQPAITKVNRQVRSEALPEFYRSSPFNIGPWRRQYEYPSYLDGSIELEWLKRIGPANTRLIRDLDFVYESDGKGPGLAYWEIQYPALLAQLGVAPSAIKRHKW